MLIDIPHYFDHKNKIHEVFFFLYAIQIDKKN